MAHTHPPARLIRLAVLLMAIACTPVASHAQDGTTRAADDLLPTPKAGSLMLTASPFGILNPMGAIIPVGIGYYVHDRVLLIADGNVPLVAINPTNENRIADWGGRLSARVYVGQPRRVGPRRGHASQRWYLGVNYTYRRRHLTRLNYFASNGDSLEHYNRADIRQEGHGWNAFAGMDLRLSSRLSMAFQFGFGAIHYYNRIGDIQWSGSGEAPYRHDLFSTVRYDGGGQTVAMPHVDLQFGWLLNP